MVDRYGSFFKTTPRSNVFPLVVYKQRFADCATNARPVRMLVGKHAGRVSRACLDVNTWHET